MTTDAIARGRKPLPREYSGQAPQSRRFTSRVIHGSRHGRSIGYPTVNLAVTDSVKRALGRHGVYAVRATVRGQSYAGALFWGKRALFRDTEPVCEIMLLDFDGDAYGEEVAVEAIGHMRDVVAVKDNTELKQLIKKDVQDVKRAYDLPRS